VSDAASYVVELIDKVSGPSFRASQAVDKLNKQLKKTGTIGTKFTGAGPVPDVVKRLNRKALGTFAKAKVFNPLGSAMASGIDGALSSLTSFAKYGVVAIGSFGVAVAGFAVKSTVHMAMFAEKTRMAFGLLTGNKAIGEQVFTRTVQLSRELGLDVEETAHSMQKLLAMQFSPPDAEKWVKLGSDLRSVGVEGSAIQRVMLDIAHVKATGKLSQRNVNMFANAGVSAQLLMEEVGKAMGTNEAGAIAAMHKGKVTSAIALPALEKAIMRKTHEHAAGEAGTGFANKTLTGLIDQLKNAPSLFFLKMADKAQGAIGKLKPLVDAVMKAIDNIQGDTFVRFIGTALDMVTKMVPLAMEFAQGFGDGFSSIVDAMNEIDPAKASMQTARDLGHAIADGFGVALKVLKEIADMLIWFDKHRDVAAATAGALGVTRLLGAGTVGKGLLLGGKGLVKGGAMLSRLAGLGGAAATAAGTTAATTAATGTAAAAGAGTAAAGTAGTAIAAGAGGLGVGAAAAAGLAVAGVAAAAAGYVWREEIAKWMLSPRTDATSRGVGESDTMSATPTATLTNLQRAAANRTQNTNVELHTTVNIDGSGKDGEQLGKDIAEHQRDGLEQFFQSQALEQGAM
jgi:hypothetical protein